MPKKAKNVDQQTIKHFWYVTKSYKSNFYASFLILVNSVLLYTVDPYIIGKVLGGLTQPQFNVGPYIVAFVVVSLTGVLANRIGFINLMSLIPKAMANLQSQCFDMLLRRGTTYHNNTVSGKLISDATDYVGAYSQLASTIYITIVPFVFTLVSGLVLITYSSWVLGLIMLLMSSVAIGTGVYGRIKMAPARKKRIKANKDAIAHLADSVVNIGAVKTFAKEPTEMQQHLALSRKLEKRRTVDWRYVATSGSNRIAGLLLFELLFLIVIVNLVRRDPSMLAAGIFAFSYTITLTNKLFDIGNMMRNVEEALIQAEPMTIALGQEVEVVDVPDAANLQVTKGEVVFSDVDFKYSDNSGENYVFKKLNVNIQPGQKIGLVGPSGGGKSTVTKLLLRFEDIQGGSIRIDDQQISAVTQSSLRQSISYVPQESLLFHRTILENIMYGNPSATQGMVIQAAKDAHAHDFIMSLPDGYDTVVGERGVKLSGGQRQRVAIARAMLKNAPIIVLDEATSALDSESEVVIQDALWKLMEGRTALVIAHRLSTIQRMDRILVLQDGKIIEDGSHAQLLENNGLYARLWSHQSGGFISE